MVVWDLLTKRPVAIWKAHDGQIISMYQTPWGLLTQGRDAAIRMWKPPFTGLATDASLLASQAVGRLKSDRALNSTDALVAAWKHPPVFEIPVNSLNFCSVAVANNLLATPATRDSEKFDVYSLLDSFSLLRLVEGYGELLEDSVEGNRTGTGIVMRLLFVGEDLLFAGYESGRVRGFRLKKQVVDSASERSRLVMNKDMKVTMVMDEQAHVPQPVLSLEYDSTTKKLYTGSALKKLVVYSIGHLVEEARDLDDLVPSLEVETFNTGHYGIQSLLIADDLIAAGFWDGNVLVYNKSLEKLLELERQEEFIQPEEDNEASKTSKKSLCLHIWHPSPVSVETATSKKALLRQRKTQSDDLLFVGYGDGLVSAYKLK